MPYISSIERIEIEKGRTEQIQDNIATTLQIRFGPCGKRLAARIRKISNLEQLRGLFVSILKAYSLTEVRRLVRRVTALYVTASAIKNVAQGY
jgi:hypothetical protein